MRVFNFSAGPAVLPESVLQKAAAEMLDWHGSGMSVMEMSHRGKEFIAIAAKVEADLRGLLAIPANYKVLFLQGGAIAENAIVPMNLLRGRTVADYIHTGEWSKKSIKEAGKYCEVNVAASAEDKKFTYVPERASWKLSPGSAYVHVCTNETIGGVEYPWTPDAGDIPIVADMSSHILSRVIDVSKYGVIYGGAQKNMGPAGLTLVIVRDDLLDRALAITPSAFNWQEQSAAESMLNTPPTYAMYIAGLVFERAAEHRQGTPALRDDRPERHLPQQRAQGRPLAHERRVPVARRGAGQGVSQGRRGARDGAAEGAPRGGRHPRVDLQRHADGRRAGAR
jgi:phosphoserine aminotransferase